MSPCGDYPKFGHILVITCGSFVLYIMSNLFARFIFWAEICKVEYD